MGLAYVIVGLVSAAVAVFAVQNNYPMSVKFLQWTLPDVPLAGAVLGALAAGLVLAAIPLSIGQWRWRRRVRTLESKCDMLESALAARERDNALMTPRPVPAPMPTSRTA